MRKLLITHSQKLTGKTPSKAEERKTKPTGRDHCEDVTEVAVTTIESNRSEEKLGVSLPRHERCVKTPYFGQPLSGLFTSHHRVPI